MAKKQETIKLSPSDCLNSLTEYNSRVIALTSFIESIMGAGMVDEKVKDMLKGNVDAVKEFYK